MDGYAFVHREHVHRLGEDLEEIRDWRWTQ